MKQYIELVKQVLKEGVKKGDRTGTGTLSVFGTQNKYDLRDGFPMVTTKKVRFDAILYELLWFLRGSTNINDDLTQHTPMWNPWADENGELGPVYGYQWVKWEQYNCDKDNKNCEIKHINQIQNAIDLIKNNPESRRILVSAWNVSDLEKMALMPCHAFFQFYVADGRLDCQLYQRSADIAIGVPYNIASYSILLTMMARECGLNPGIFTHTIGDAHVYLNHIEGLEEQIKREIYPLSKLEINKKPFWDLKFEDFKLEDYKNHPFIKYPIAV